MDHYVPILIFALVAFTVPIIILLLAKVVRFGSYDPVKAEPYECGVKATSFALDKRFSIRYYVIAVLFVVFDVETIFLFPPVTLDSWMKMLRVEAICSRMMRAARSTS